MYSARSKVVADDVDFSLSEMEDIFPAFFEATVQADSFAHHANHDSQFFTSPNL